MNQSEEQEDYRMSPRKSLRTPKKKRRSESPLPSPVKKLKHNQRVIIVDAQAGCIHDDMEEEIEEEDEIDETISDEIVLPGVEHLNECEEIYSSLPPDITIEQIVRVTRSSVQGEQLKVTKGADRSLKIISATALMAESEADTNYHTRNTCQCVVCDRTIETGEMFLNFPDDLDRRRIWGNLLGFRYQEMLRVKSRMVTIGAICTDHFAEECFRMYNFNKAAIEALGVPKHVSPNKSPMKRKPWNCTICSFASFSPFNTYQHIMKEHIEGNKGSNSVEGTGYTCPFCRRCTYGYKTLSGFKRHMVCPPIEHCHLKRVHEMAREMCRSHQLEPVNQWSSWSEENVALAYYGFIPPKKGIMVKRGSETVPNSPVKPMTKMDARPDSASPRKETINIHRVTLTQSHRFSSLDHSSMVLASSSRMVDERGERGRHIPSYLNSPSNSNANTLADVLAGVDGGVSTEDSPSNSMAEVVNAPLDPVYLKKWMTTSDIRTSKRQIEAAQARARLFGDSLGPGDLPLPFPLKSQTIRNSHQRLINVEKDLTADLSSHRPLFSPATAIPRPRVNILRSKPAPS
ncbi:hypothetical protein PENTCL1PPCAC_11265 [Pristionchus entomophagus]|uniref:THAP-type domain-containing protein n=1 Tax=Pristionchus entomophagus TaxID=358040 RepID=A0AAV5T0V1_9BILA|nr:hypothetical protein PENTCL1PPCAC_11265 [Pristionchus entomophagus]